MNTHRGNFICGYTEEDKAILARMPAFFEVQCIEARDRQYMERRMRGESVHAYPQQVTP